MAKTFHVIIEQDEDGGYIGKVAELHGCLSQGDTLDELMINIKEAIELCLEVHLFLAISKIQQSQAQ